MSQQLIKIKAIKLKELEYVYGRDWWKKSKKRDTVIVISEIKKYDVYQKWYRNKTTPTENQRHKHILLLPSPVDGYSH